MRLGAGDVAHRSQVTSLELIQRERDECMIYVDVRLRIHVNSVRLESKALDLPGRMV